MAKQGYPSTGSRYGGHPGASGYPAAGARYGAHPDGSSGGWVAPTVPVAAKAGAFWWADDISGAGTWAPRYDTLGVGSFTGVNTTLEAGGWVTPEGNRPSMRLDSTASAYLRNDNLAALFTADDAQFDIVIWYQNLGVNAANAIFSASSSASTTPKRVLLFTAAGYRWTQQTTTNVFTHNATNLLQQMVRVKQVNTAPGTATSVWRNEDPDPAGTLTADVATQACDRFLIGAQWNGAGGPVNFQNCRIRGIWIGKLGAADLTADDGVELHNWGQGGYNTAPLYTGATVYYLPVMVGQSNSPEQGLATGAVAGMPDADVKTYWRNLNNDADDPTAYRALNVRPGANGYSSSAQYMPTGTFAVPHHMCGVGKGATSAGSDWGGNNGAGPTNQLQGYYSTDLYSECRRNIMMTKARYGGAPIVQILWQQGENDASAGAVVAGQYGTNWATIKAYLRALVLRTWGTANAHVHAVQLNPNQTGGGIVLADLNTIRAAMVTDDSGDANESLIETNDITALQVDNLHYAAAGYATIASRLVTSIKASNGSL